MTKLLYGPAILFTALLFSNCKTITSPTIVSKKSSSKENYNPDEIIVIVELKINKGSNKEILEFCERYKNEVDKVEPDALGWSFFNSEDNKVTLIERYKNSEANLTHVDLFVSENGPKHDLFKEIIGYFSVESIVVLGNASETLKKRNSLTGFPFIYKPLISGYSR